MDSTTHENMAKRTKLVNVLSLFCAGIGLFSLPFDWVTAPRWMVIEDAIAFFLYLTIPLLNRAGHNRLARIVFLFLGNLIIFLDVLLLGLDSGIDLMFFGLAAFALMLFDLNEKRLILIWTIIPILAYFWIHQLPPGYALDPTAAQMGKEYALYSAFVAFVSIGTSIYFLQKVNQWSEMTLKNLRAQAIASEKMAALGEMSASLAHEINTPLTSLQINAELLKRLTQAETFDKNKIEQHIEKIDKMIERITKITFNLQTFSRDAEHDPIKPISVDYIIQDTLELCREKFKAHHIDLKIEFENKRPLLLHCRAVQISQVLLNLLNNAFAATAHLQVKWVKITVRDLKDHAEISVMDSGKGIPSVIQEKLFLPFFTTKPADQGTGLGLSISKRIIEMHQGEIFLNPNSQHTEFLIHLKTS